MDKNNVLTVWDCFDSGIWDSWEECIDFLLIFTQPMDGETCEGLPTHDEVLEAQKMGCEEYRKRMLDQNNFINNFKNNQNQTNNG